MKILYIDDIEETTRLIAKELAKVGYEVHTIKDPWKALEFLKVNRDIHIVLTDIELEPFGGIELLMHIISLRSDIEVIVITGNQDEEHKERALELGVFDYIRNPFSLRELCQTLERCKKQLKM